jgi:hypothetical protein
MLPTAMRSKQNHLAQTTVLPGPGPRTSGLFGETPRNAPERNRRFNNTVVLESIRALKFRSAPQSNVDMVRQQSSEGTGEATCKWNRCGISWDLVV